MRTEVNRTVFVEVFILQGNSRISKILILLKIFPRNNFDGSAKSQFSFFFSTASIFRNSIKTRIFRVFSYFIEKITSKILINFTSSNFNKRKNYEFNNTIISSR